MSDEMIKVRLWQCSSAPKSNRVRSGAGRGVPDRSLRAGWLALPLGAGAGVAAGARRLWKGIDMSEQETNDGGPAFPVAYQHTDPCASNPRGTNEQRWEGMSLRDYFATHASEQDILYYKDEAQGRLTIRENWRTLARHLHADAMLAERTKKP